jgi:outer membrane protein OmpA-like peptidoglycan-associated protein
VVNYLVGLGVPATRLQAEGFGFSKPKPGHPASDPLNRRVEIVRN